MIKAIIVDDESHIREIIQRKVTKYFEKEIVVVAEAEGVASGVKEIEHFEPNLLFLDVRLLDGTGFDLLELTRFKNFQVIFITAFDSYAIEAIKVRALDYILKPISDTEFEEAVQKALARKSDGVFEKLEELSTKYAGTHEKKRVILKTNDMIHSVLEEDILYCGADGGYTTFFLANSEKILVSKTIKKVQELLSEDNFIRCHKSYLVNVQHVLKYNKRGFLVLKDNVQVPVSGRQREYVLDKIF